jgi:hypothetical protein
VRAGRARFLMRRRRVACSARLHTQLLVWDIGGVAEEGVWGVDWGTRIGWLNDVCVVGDVAEGGWRSLGGTGY